MIIVAKFNEFSITTTAEENRLGFVDEEQLIWATNQGRVIYWVMHWLYRRSTKEVSFVRTGFLGEKVVINGGAFVWPIIHDITPVNMNTLQLEVVRDRDDALITNDRMRVDVEAEFYVRVRPTRDGLPVLHAVITAAFNRHCLSPSTLMSIEAQHH